MEPHEYRTLFEFETSYWWFRSLHAIILDTLRSLQIGSETQVLDAGCGTGQNLLNITRGITPQAFGFDISPHAVIFWQQRGGLGKTCRASVNEIPFPDDTFHAVLCADVLESYEVLEEQACNELWRVVKDGGLIILIVPAYDWLLTKEHHRAVHASRRYSKQRVISLLNNQPVELVRVTHLFASLLPAVACYRLGLRFLASDSKARPRSELRRLPPLLNELLCRIMNIERRILRRIDLPFGSSIMAVVRKVGK